LVNKDEIGRGAFAAVFTAELSSGGQKVAVKKFLHIEAESQKKIVLKEAKLLNGLTHPNIIEFKGICNDEYAILLEYLYFDFKPFGINAKAHCLSSFPV
jgi:serine/threonine protein kinase